MDLVFYTLKFQIHKKDNLGGYFFNYLKDIWLHLVDSVVAQWQSGRQVTELGSLKTFAAILCPWKSQNCLQNLGIGDSVLT